MNIKSMMLERGAIDSTYLDQYLELTSISLKKGEGYTELHHILPQCLFPEYSNLKKNMWNRSRLSLRDHLKAHFLLTKIFPNEQKIWYAIHMMTKVNGSTEELTKEQYEIYEESKIRFSEAIKIRNGGSNNYFNQNPDKSPWKGKPGWLNPTCSDKRTWASAHNIKKYMEQHPGCKDNEVQRAFGAKNTFYIVKQINEGTFPWEEWSVWMKYNGLEPYEMLEKIPTVGELRSRPSWLACGRKPEITLVWYRAQELLDSWIAWPKMKDGKAMHGWYKANGVTESNFGTILRLFRREGWIPKEDQKWVEWRKSKEAEFGKLQTQPLSSTTCLFNL